MTADQQLPSKEQLLNELLDAARSESIVGEEFTSYARKCAEIDRRRSRTREAAAAVLAAMRAAHEPCPECEKRRHANDRVNYETTEDGFRICRGYHERYEGCEWEYFVPRAAQPPPPELPEELFDGHAVWLETGNVQSRDVTKVLDAVVKLIRKRQPRPTKPDAPFGTCGKCGEPITSFHNINGCSGLGERNER